MKHVAFFGDDERTFALPYHLIEELQRKTGIGFGALFHRLRTMHFSIADISETIRLALIGGGTEGIAAAVQERVCRQLAAKLAGRSPVVRLVMDKAIGGMKPARGTPMSPDCR